MSRYAIRHATTGLERSFEDKQAIADFFHAEGHSPADWDGHQCLGELPTPTGVEQSAVEAPAAPAPRIAAKRAPAKPKAPVKAQPKPAAKKAAAKKAPAKKAAGKR